LKASQVRRRPAQLRLSFIEEFVRAVRPPQGCAIVLTEKPAIQLDKEPAIMVREPDAAMQPTPQDNQLMSKHRVLSFKPHLRLEWRGQDGQNATEQPDHSASLGDSIAAPTQIRFSVHTAVTTADFFLAWQAYSSRRGFED
jgi:hypothetical protein